MTRKAMGLRPWVPMIMTGLEGGRHLPYTVGLVCLYWLEGQWFWFAGRSGKGRSGGGNSRGLWQFVEMFAALDGGCGSLFGSF